MADVVGTCPLYVVEGHVPTETVRSIVEGLVMSVRGAVHGRG